MDVRLMWCGHNHLDSVVALTTCVSGIDNGRLLICC